MARGSRAFAHSQRTFYAAFTVLEGLEQGAVPTWSLWGVCPSPLAPQSPVGPSILQPQLPRPRKGKGEDGGL